MSTKKNQSYNVITQLFRYKHSISSAEIQQKLADNDLPNSERTVQRLLSDLKNIGLDFEYNPQNRKFKFNPSDDDYQTKLIGLMVAADFMQSVAAFPTNTLQFIEFDDRVVAKGSTFLPDLFKAITTTKWIEVTYQRYENDHPKTHLVAPLFLKEFNYRWYLLAVIKTKGPGKTNMPLLFGIDRIVNLSLTDQSFNKIKLQKLSDYTAWTKGHIEKPMDLFDDVIGVRFTQAPVQEVILKFHPDQAPFIKSQPWHSTQKILVENEQEFTIEICVRPNDDLLTMILSQHGNVEVIEPKELRQSVIDMLQKSLDLYAPTKTTNKKNKRVKKMT